MVAKHVRNRWFWAITAANLTVCVLLIVFIYAILLTLGAFAAGVTTWPIFVLFATGSVLTAISLILTGSVMEKPARRLGYAANGVPLFVYCAVLLMATSMWLHTTRRLFLIPAGFQGNLYVVHAIHHGKKIRNSYFRTTYLFSNEGVVETQDPAPTAFSDEYAYVYPDGHLQKLGDAGPGTLPDTPENRANATEVVTYFARSFTPSGPNDCAMEEISIGTRSFLLSRRFESPTPDTTHLGMCH